MVEEMVRLFRSKRSYIFMGSNVRFLGTMLDVMWGDTFTMEELKPSKELINGSSVKFLLGLGDKLFAVKGTGVT
jgi:hypothetical protein